MSAFIDIASDAITSIGQLGTGQSISPEEAEQALRAANRMIGMWNRQRLMLPLVTQRPYTLSATVQDYTVGPTGSIGGVATRPTFVESGQVTPPGSSQSDSVSMLDKSQWDAIADKGAMCSALGTPSSMYVEYSYPNIGLHFWPVPSNAAGLTIGTWEPLLVIATIYDDINLPDGYEEALMYNLALELCPFYDMPTTGVEAQAVNGLNQIKALNAQAIGGSLSSSQTLKSPNVGQPQG